MQNIVYLEYDFKIEPVQPASDILVAELGEVGFESFVENEEGVVAYIQKKEWDKSRLGEVHILDHPDFSINFTVKEIEQENWNATWEQNFEPIQVGDQCVVRAPFHEKPDVTYDIIIEPKMSFGTGHHETTHMMLQFILEHDFKGKSVLDMGSGTGVLSILCAMRGAVSVDAIDIDHWCYLNAAENVDRNQCDQINVQQGDSALLTSKKYDVILANINRNILLEDLPMYVSCLKRNGQLFLSGFYLDDIPAISAKCRALGLEFEKNIEKNNWVAVKYVF